MRPVRAGHGTADALAQRQQRKLQLTAADLSVNLGNSPTISVMMPTGLVELALSAALLAMLLRWAVLF